MALSLEGKRLATASEKGTLVRVWNTADGQLLQVGSLGRPFRVSAESGFRQRGGA